VRVAEWFPAWVARHQRIVRRGDWPPGDSDYWTPALKAFIAAGTTEDEANAATDAVAVAPPRFPGDQIEAVLKAVRRHQDARSHADRPRDTSCPECAGEGLTSRWFRFEHREREVVASIACYCRCRSGRWLMGKHDGEKEIKGRIVDLALRPDVGDSLTAIYELYPVMIDAT
jgi:hypothetical protein